MLLAQTFLHTMADSTWIKNCTGTGTGSGRGDKPLKFNSAPYEVKYSFMLLCKMYEISTCEKIRY